MLALIEKLASGKVDLTPSELQVAARYFGFMAQNLDLPSIQNIWQQLPEDARTPLIPDAVNKSAARGRADATRFFLDQAARVPDAEKCFNNIFKPAREKYPYFEHTMMWDAVDSGNIETLEIILQEAQERKGVDYATKMIDVGFSHVRHAPVFQWLWRQAEEKNFTEDALVKIFHGCISGSISGFAQPEFFHDVLAGLYKLGGPKEVAHAAASAFLTGQEEGYWPASEPDLLAIVRALPKIGGHDLVRSVVREYDYALLKRAIKLPSRMIFVELYTLCEDMNDKPFLDKALNEMTAELFIFMKDYNQTVCDVVNGHKRFKDCSPKLLVDLAVMTWEAKARRGRFEVSHDTQELTSTDPNRPSDVPITSWEENMVLHATPWDFTLMAVLHQHLGRPNLYTKLFPKLPNIAQHNPRLFRNFIRNIARGNGFDKAGDACAHAFVALADRARTAEGEDAWEVHINCQNALRKIMRYTKRIGQFDKIVTRAAENDFGLLRKLEYFHASDISGAIYDAMDPVLRQNAAKGSYIPWFQLWEKKIPKSKFWREFSRRDARWVKMTGKQPPSFRLATYSPYRFKPQLYESLLPAMQHAQEIEGTGSAETHAYKLSVLFSTRNEVDHFLNKWATEWGKDNRYVVHDACLFQIPKGDWNAAYWKGKVMKFGPKAYPFLARAPEIEQIVGADPKMETLRELAAVMLKMGYKRGDEDPALAALANRYGVAEDVFNDTLDEWKTYKKNKDFLPDITIDGADVGAPGVLFRRLAPDDPLGFFLGHMSNCCQFVDGNGAPCVRYGMSSPYSGFYVWVDEAKNTLIGQSWAWIDAKDNLVFDSFERADPTGDKIFLPFLEQFAVDVRNKKYTFIEGLTARSIQEVRLGTSGQTPLLELTKVADPQRPVGYMWQYDDGTPALDSAEQYAIKPKDYRALTSAPVRTMASLPRPSQDRTRPN
ncbi:MAG: hypothetical protein WBK91_00340 [Alphaproteobacteria bacterium]